MFLFPVSQGTNRRLFSLLARLPPHFISFVLSIPSQPQPPGVSSHYKHIAEARLRLLRQSRNLTAYLPPELLLLVGRFVVRSSSPWSAGKGFALAGVCKRWRSVFTQDKELWEDVKIRGASSRAVERAETLISRGRLRFLSIWKSLDNENLGTIYRLLEGKGSDLRLLQASLGHKVCLDDVWKVLFGASPPHLLSLRVTFWPGFLPTFNPPPSDLLTLTTLEFRNIHFHTTRSLFPLLRRLPNLERIKLVGGVNVRLGSSGIERTNVLELPSLKSFSLTEYYGDPFMDSFYLVAPLLDKLDLSLSEFQSHHNFLFPPAPYQPNTTRLTTLRLGDSQSLPDWNELSLLDDLKRMPSLTSLFLEDSTISDVLIDGLQGEGEDKLVCPLLSSLDLGDSRTSWTAVRRMVSARWGEDEGGKMRMRRITYRRNPVTPFRDEEDRLGFEWLEREMGWFSNLWQGEDAYDDDSDA